MKRAVGVILALSLCLQLVGCKTIPKREEGGKESSSPQMESVQLERLSYKVPADWRKVKGDQGYYHYPQKENEAGFLSVLYSEQDVSAATDTEMLYDVYDAVLEGMEKGADSFHLIGKERVKLAGVEALKVNYTERFDPHGVYTLEAYIFVDPEKKGMYFAIFTASDALKEEMGAQIASITSSFRFGGKGISWGDASTSGGATESSSSAAAGDNSTGSSSQGAAGGQGGSSHAGASSSGQSSSVQSSAAQSDPSQSGGTPASGATAEQKKALSRAKSYLGSSAFSRQGLIKQLEYEKFSHEDAVYGADHCGADWNAQALKKAKSYLNTAAFSQPGLTHQLQYEGFTDEQAAYGVSNCGADWNAQALKKAKSYLNTAAFSQSGLTHQLKYEGFTDEQTAYGVNNCGANWNEQAVKKAKSYLKIFSYSRQELIDQLKYEGFTAEQAAYGADGAGL